MANAKNNKNQKKNIAEHTGSKSRKQRNRKNSKKRFWFTVLILILAVLVLGFYAAKENGYLEDYGIYPDETYISESLTEKAESFFNADKIQDSGQDGQELKANTSVQENVNKNTESDDSHTDEESSAFITSALEIPACPATEHENKADDHEVHTYSGFTLCYRESYEDAEWVAYTLTKDELNAVIGRTDDFRADTQISTGSATPQDYTRSGYDRGHLAPAADMEWSEQSCRDSFLMSNMTPQAPQFNRGLWKTLEEQVRTWADTFGEVTVVTGPVLEKPADSYPKIGTDNVAVPEYFYKVLLAKTDSSDGYSTTIGIGFILPNTKCSGDIWNYAVSIDEVEKRTGLDFFSMLPDAKENSVERNTDFSAWK